MQQKKKKKKSDKCRQIHIMGQKSLVTNVYKCDDYTNWPLLFPKLSNSCRQYKYIKIYRVGIPWEIDKLSYMSDPPPGEKSHGISADFMVLRRGMLIPRFLKKSIFCNFRYIWFILGRCGPL